MEESIERRLRVLVVDDLEVIHWGYRLMLGERTWVERCVAAASISDAVALARRYEPHVAIVESYIEGRPASEAIAKLRAACPSMRVLVTSSSGWMSPAAVRLAGAQGFITKCAPADELANAVHQVGLGRVTFARREALPDNVLTARERSVLTLIASGATNREIGAELYISPHTVKEHASTMFRKLGARNRAEAVQRAQRLGLLA
jgi:DNA-binding NarL/FixJ family response regulator